MWYFESKKATPPCVCKPKEEPRPDIAVPAQTDMFASIDLFAESMTDLSDPDNSVG